MAKKNASELSKQFIEDMEIIINLFKKDETSFFNTSVKPKLKATATINQSNFPHYIYTSIYKEGNKTLSSFDIEEMINDRLKTDSLTLEEKEKGITLSMKKGQHFEDISSELMNNSRLIQNMKDKLFLSFEDIKGKHKREDVKFNELYSFDFKYSGYSSEDEKFKGIIKGSTANHYNSINDIERNIIASLYSGGAGTWEDFIFKPSKGILQENNSPRKNIMFIFKEDGYWTSYCLDVLTKWAAKRIIETEWKNSDLRNKENWQSFESSDGLNTHTYNGFWYGLNNNGGNKHGN